MVFDKNVSKNEIEKYENDCLERVLNSSLISVLKNELCKKKLKFTVEIIHSDCNLKKYHSYLEINIFNEKNELIPEYDEPNCCLMLCEPICYMSNRHIVGIDLINDSEFIESLESLIDNVKISVINNK